MKRFRRIICAAAAASMSLTLMSAAWSGTGYADEYTTRPISVFVDNIPVSFVSGQEPLIMNDRTMVPLRAVSEALDATVYWFQDDKKIQIVKYDKTLTMTLDVSTLSVYNIVSGAATFIKDMPLDAPPTQAGEAQGYRTYVPIRVIAEAFGADVSWDMLDNGEMNVKIISHDDKVSVNQQNILGLKSLMENTLFSTTGRILVVGNQYFLQDTVDELCLIELTNIPPVTDYWTQQLGVNDNNPSGTYVAITGIVQKNSAGFNTIPLKRSVTGIRPVASGPAATPVPTAVPEPTAAPSEPTATPTATPN